MTAPIEQQTPPVSDKELNFRRMEAQYQRKLEETERRAQEAERLFRESQNKQEPEDDESDDAPYVEHKKLEKKLKKFGNSQKQEIQNEIQKAVHIAKEEAKREAFLEQNPDFYEVLEKNAEKFGKTKERLAKSILAMPDTFERQVLAYQTIKELGIDKPPVKESSIQDKIDANKRGQFYQPTNIGSPAYAGASSDYSDTGKKAAYDKLKELQKRVRF